MRITQIVPSLEARHGGPSRSVLALSRALAEMGNNVELLSTTSQIPTAAKSTPDLHVHEFPRQWPLRFSVSAPMAAHLADCSAEVIHHHALWLRPLHYAHRTATRLDCPLIISPRGMMSSWAWNHQRWKKYLADRLIHPGALSTSAGWHATSPQEADDIRHLGFQQPICVAPNGVDLPPQPQITAASQWWRERLPEIGDRSVAIFYSRFHDKKRILELLDLWGALAPSDWVLLAIGIPEQYSVAELRHRVVQAGHANKILVHDGTAAPPPYGIARLYLLPSHSENFGMTVAEALASGVPVLTTNTTPWEGLESNGAGRCVEWSKYEPALRQLTAETPDQLKSRGETGRAWMQQEFSWSSAAVKLAGFYASLTQGN